MKRLVDSWLLQNSEHRLLNCTIKWWNVKWHPALLYIAPFFLVFSCCFILLISVLKLRCFPLCLSLDCHFLLYLLFIPPSLTHLSSATHPLFSSSFFHVFFVSSCFHLGEEGIHTEELETDLGKIFCVLKQKLSPECWTKCGHMISSVHIAGNPSFWILWAGCGEVIFEDK